MLKSPLRAITVKFSVVLAVGFATLESLSAHAGIVDGLLGRDNYPQCILERMPGAVSDDAANQISAKCAQEFPVGESVQKQTGLFAAFYSGNACTLKKTKDTPSALAKQIIQYCCYMLYETKSSHQ